MKFILALVVALLPSVAFAAKHVPTPKPRPDTEIVVAQAQTNPDPFNVQRAPVAQPPSVQTQPIVVHTPVQGDSWLSWIQTTIAAIFTALFGKLAFKLPATPGTVVGGLDSSKVHDIVTAVLHPAGSSIINDPNLRAAVDAALLRAIQSGLPGQALQTGLSFVPGAGPIVSTVEPIVRKIVMEILEKKAVGQAASG